MLTELWALAERQYGLVLRDQAIAIVGERRLDRLLAAGRLLPVGTSVYRVPGSPRTPEQQLLAAVWAAGTDVAVAGARSAAWLWGLVDDPPRVPEVTVPAGRYRRLDGVRLVQSLDLGHDAATVRRGIPTLKPALTMVELARVLPGDELADALERVLGLVSMGAMWATLDRYGRPGRNGIARLRAVVSDRALQDKPSDSEVEERAGKVLRAHGITGLTFHHPIRDERGRLVAVPDFAEVRTRSAIEIDGSGKFRERGYVERFTERRHALRALGWDLEHFAWAHVVRRPAYFASTVRRFLDERAHSLSAA